MKKTERNSNIELLRILSMCLIVAGHFVGQSGAIEYTSCVNDYLLVLISSGARIAVNIFLLIAVWYLVDAKFSASRIVKMCGQVYFLAALFTLLSLLIDYTQVQFKTIVYGFIPFIGMGRALWFASSYLTLLIFKPYLDVILKWERKTLITFASLFFIFMSIFSTVLISSDAYVVDTIWFAAIYLVIGTFKKYPLQYRTKILGSLVLFVGGYITLATARYIVRISSADTLLLQIVRVVSKVYSDDIKSLPNFIIAYSIFSFFISLKPKYNRLINGAALGTFSVYIIHQVPAFYPVLWSSVFNAEAWIPEHNVSYVVFVVTIVFTTCSVIDALRRKWLEPLFVKSKAYFVMENWLNNTLEIQQ